MVNKYVVNNLKNIPHDKGVTRYVITAEKAGEIGSVLRQLLDNDRLEQEDIILHYDWKNDILLMSDSVDEVELCPSVLDYIVSDETVSFWMYAGEEANLL